MIEFSAEVVSEHKLKRKHLHQLKYVLFLFLLKKLGMITERWEVMAAKVHDSHLIRHDSQIQKFKIATLAN